MPIVQRSGEKLSCMGQSFTGIKSVLIWSGLWWLKMHVVDVITKNSKHRGKWIKNKTWENIYLTQRKQHTKKNNEKYMRHQTNYKMADVNPTTATSEQSPKIQEGKNWQNGRRNEQSKNYSGRCHYPSQRLTIRLDRKPARIETMKEHFLPILKVNNEVTNNLI